MGIKKIHAFQIAVFLSAFLLFQIQPVMSKVLLPRFGGSYLVWGACMMFFQCLLLAGYIYAHTLQKWLGVKLYGKFHFILLLLPLLFFPFNFNYTSAFLEKMPLVISIFGILFLTVSLPFLALSTTSLILQRWLSVSDIHEKDNPYILYGASNLGSILALLTYPVLIEPFLTLEQQGFLWSIFYFLLIFIHIFCFPFKTDGTQVMEEKSSKGPEKKVFLGWFLLSMAGSCAFLSFTNIITFNIASVPFLWVLPLSVYLITFVLTFKKNCWYPLWIEKAFYWVAVIGSLLYLSMQLRMSVPAILSLLMELAILFVICLNCHGTLYRWKPSDINNLTIFYLALAWGGMAGSLIVSWLMPLISNSLVEYPFSFLMASISTGYYKYLSGNKEKKPSFIFYLLSVLTIICLTLLPWALNTLLHFDIKIILVIIAFPLAISMRWMAGHPWKLSFVILCFLISINWTEELSTGGTSVAKIRNFYGIYKIYDSDGERYLQHGTTLHGRQYLDPFKARVPLSYYYPGAPAGELLCSRDFYFQNTAMIGLGTGALAAYTTRGQSFTIYELDSDNVTVAEKYFTYIKIAKDHGASVRFVTGDGRISLQKEDSNIYDLLIVDAFNSGSIPVHLLTVEAFREYLRVLKPQGLLLFHISNEVLDLKPVIYSIAKELNVYACVKNNSNNLNEDTDFTVWMAVTEDRNLCQRLRVTLGWSVDNTENDKLPPPWTDKYSNLFRVLIKE